MICPDCGRRVRAAHPPCEGDPGATCSVYGCGLAPVSWREVDPYGDGARTVWLRYCEEHSEEGDRR